MNIINLIIIRIVHSGNDPGLLKSIVMIPGPAGRHNLDPTRNY